MVFMYQAKSLKTKRLESRLGSSVNHSLKSSRFGASMIKRKRKATSAKLIESSSHMLVVLMYQVVILVNKAPRVKAKFMVPST